MNRDRIAEPHFPTAPEAPGGDEAHVWRVVLPATEGRAAARQALREILGAYLGEEPDAVALTVEEGGKPTLAGRWRPESREGGPPISFNLSHSGGLALVAVTARGTAVGVDVERLRPRHDLVRLAARWLSAADAEAVAAAAAGARERVFYAAWTRHEARIKCTGTGLSGPPPEEEIVAVELEIDAGYAAALATEGGAPTNVRRFEFAA